MSNQCCNQFSYRSFSLFTPLNISLKPYRTSLRPIFPFQHNFILIGNRSRSSRSCIPSSIAAQSSSDIVLIATTEHRDGSTVFRFGDASEVVKIDEVIEEIGSQTEPENNIVKVLDVDQERQVIVKTIERRYESDEGEFNEVADEISNVENDIDIGEKETNFISDLSDYSAEWSKKLSDVSEEEILSSQSDSKMNNSVEAVETIPDEIECSDPEGTLLKESDDENEDSSVSVELESLQVSQIEVTDVNQPYENELDNEDANESDTENSIPPEIPATMQISDVELSVSVNENVEDDLNVRLIDSASENVEEKLQDMDISEATLIDEIPLYSPIETEEEDEPVLEDKIPIMQVSEIELEDSTDQNLDLKDNDEIEEISDSVKLETMQVSQNEKTLDEISGTEFVNVKDQVMQISDIELEDTMGQNLDDRSLKDNDEIEDISGSVKLETMQVSQNEPTLDEIAGTEFVNVKDQVMQISDIELEDTMGQNLDDKSLKDNDEIEDLSVYAEIETRQIEVDLQVVENEDSANEDLEEVLTTKIMDVNDQIDENELQPDNNDVANEIFAELILEDEVNQPNLTTFEVMNVSEIEVQDTSEGDTEGVTVNISDVKLTDAANEDLENNINTNEGVEPILDQAVEEENDVINEIFSESVTIVEDEVRQPDLVTVELETTMQVSETEDEDATCQNLDGGILQVIDEDVEQLSHQLEAQLDQDDSVNHNIVEECDESDAVATEILVKEVVHDALLEAERTESNVSSNGVSEDTELLLAVEPDVKREDINLTGYFLSSGAALLEHPNKALTGGDDACFVAGSKWLGVASGVSRWSFEGTDPGVYAEKLMRTCEDILLDTSSVPITNPVELVCKGVKQTNMSGSSNVLIANFDGQALHVANIGDTGFLIIRHGAMYKKSSPLLHEFHFALQLEHSDDPLQLVEEHTVELEVGDIVVSATDGLFDNLYEREIAIIVSKSVQAGMNPQEIAKVLAKRAQEVGKSALVRSPFSDAAQAAGYTGYAGGKPDNVAVIVSLVENRSNILQQ